MINNFIVIMHVKFQKGLPESESDETSAETRLQDTDKYRNGFFNYFMQRYTLRACTGGEV